MSNSDGILYSDLLLIIKHIVQLRTRLISTPSEQDVEDYHALIRAFETYTNSPRLPQNNQNGMQYLFGDDTINSGVISDADVDADADADADIEPEDLFEDEYDDEHDDEDRKKVESMLKKSAIELDRAISNKNYVVIAEEINETEPSDGLDLR
jgi:hypothetical protein